MQTSNHPHDINQNGPVVIGGVGGSGTRVVAEILTALNYYLGNDLDGPLDYLGYTLLFKRKNWFFRESRQPDRDIESGLGILQKSFSTHEPLTLSEFWFLLRATASMALNGHNHLGEGKGIWAVQRARQLLNQRNVSTSGFRGWGWKEPNSHLLMEEITHFYTNSRYIHTIRHGLDMAYSENQQQLYNWGPLFAVDRPLKRDQIPQASFRYWVRANRKVLEKGQSLGPKRFFLLNYDQLCLQPREEITKLVEFLEIDIDEEILRKVSCLPKLPSSAGRYKKVDLRGFESADLAFLKEVGFSADR